MYNNMGEVTITQQQLPDPDALYNQGKQDLSNLSEIKIGSGSSIFYTDKEGSRWGHVTFESAKAWIKIDGSAKFKTSAGDVLMSTDDTDGNYINVINTALNTASKTILTDFTFQSTDYAGAFKSGNPTWDDGTGLITGGSGVLINARGILGASAGVATFTLDATTGNATFAGTLSAASGTLGSLTIASGGNIKFGKTAYTDDTNAGLWLGDVSGVAKLNIGSSATKYLHYDGTDLTILGGNITGANIKTGTTGNYTQIDSNNIKFYNGANQKGFLRPDATSNVVLGADGSFFLTALDGTPNIEFTAGGSIHIQGNSQNIRFASGRQFEDQSSAISTNGDFRVDGGYYVKPGSTTYGGDTGTFYCAGSSGGATTKKVQVRGGIITDLNA